MRRRGDIVGDRYVILDTLGVGGMATVYRAQHLLSRRPVALKVMHAEVLASPGSAERFRREASAGTAIGHPGLVEVYDAGVDPDGGALFLAMELLDGEHLGRRLRRPDTTRRDALRLIAALLEPLVAAHEAGFVHRDLKPENVFVTHDGAVKLLDLGLAKHRDAKTLTATGNALGTPHYMAPEQFMSSSDATPAADVWAVGVMLYESLGGRHPFDAPSPQAALIRVVTQPPPPLGELAPEPASLASIVDRCLARDPAARPDSASLRDALAPFLDDGSAALDEALSSASPRALDETVQAARVDGGTPPASKSGRRPSGIDTSSWPVHRGDGFRFRVPPGWRARDSLVAYVAAKYEAPDAAADEVTPRVLLKVEPFPDGDTQSYVGLGLEKMTHVGRLYQSVDSALGGRPTLEIDGGFPDQAPPYRTVRRAVVIDGVGYVLMGDAPAERWHEWVATFRAVLNSFAFDAAAETESA